MDDSQDGEKDLKDLDLLVRKKAKSLLEKLHLRKPGSTLSVEDGMELVTFILDEGDEVDRKLDRILDEVNRTTVLLMAVLGSFPRLKYIGEKLTPQAEGLQWALKSLHSIVRHCDEFTAEKIQPDGSYSQKAELARSAVRNGIACLSEDISYMTESMMDQLDREALKHHTEVRLFRQRLHQRPKVVAQVDELDGDDVVVIDNLTETA